MKFKKPTNNWYPVCQIYYCLWKLSIGLFASDVQWPISAKDYPPLARWCPGWIFPEKAHFIRFERTQLGQVTLRPDYSGEKREMPGARGGAAAAAACSVVHEMINIERLLVLSSRFPSHTDEQEQVWYYVKGLVLLKNHWTSIRKSQSTQRNAAEAGLSLSHTSHGISKRHPALT